MENSTTSELPDGLSPASPPSRTDLAPLRGISVLGLAESSMSGAQDPAPRPTPGTVASPAPPASPPAVQLRRRTGTSTPTGSSSTGSTPAVGTAATPSGTGADTPFTGPATGGLPLSGLRNPPGVLPGSTAPQGSAAGPGVAEPGGVAPAATVQRSPASGASTAESAAVALTPRSYPAPLPVPVPSRRRDEPATVQRSATARPSTPSTSSSNAAVQRRALPGTAPPPQTEQKQPGAAPTGRALPSAAPSRQELDELARQLIGPLSRLLKAELRMDRERNGRLRDH
ncbi:hypothetical protein ACQPZQ_32990 [Pseudonocardia sp. CA-142604]|uniref:hypothetical protein n=1 Tax=Pseudonocardia sp. CA-142604 TaxID=3240024 RepID=UPI003D8BF26B